MESGGDRIGNLSYLPHQPAISVDGLHKRFGTNEVLRGIDLTANDGEVISLIGASGSGKSTLLRCITMLEVPDSGRVTVGPDSIAPENGRLSRNQERTARLMRGHLGFVFQSFNLWPHKTVLQNVVEAPIHVQKRPRAECIEEATSLLEPPAIQKTCRQMSDGTASLVMPWTSA